MKTKLLEKKGFQPHPEYPKVEISSVIDKDLSTNYRCAIVKINPDGEILPHTHETLEVAYIVEGEGELLLNGKYETIREGDTMYAPAGIVHGIRNQNLEKMILFATFPNCQN